MAKIIIKRPFGAVPNTILFSKILSLRAKGIYAYIQAKSDNWDFSIKGISTETKEGRDAINEGLRELEKVGLLERKKTRTEKGTWDMEYILHEDFNQCRISVQVTSTENPYTEKPYTENPQTIKTRLIKKEQEEKEETLSSNEDNSIAEPAEPKRYGNQDINKMLDFLRKSVGVDDFKDTHPTWYAKHCLSLIKKIGKEEFFERLKAVLSDPFKAKNCNKLAYLYGELKAFIHSPIIEPKDPKARQENPDPLLNF